MPEAGLSPAEEDTDPIIVDAESPESRLKEVSPERDLSGFRRTSVRSLLTIDSDGDCGSLPSDDGANDAPPIDIPSDPAIASSGEEATPQNPKAQRHASMDMVDVFLPDSSASSVSGRSRRSSAMPLGGTHGSLESCNYDSLSANIARGGEAYAGPGQPPRGRTVKRISQSMRRVSFSGHVQSLLDERLEMYIRNMIGNTTNMHKQDERVSFDKFALLSVKSATLAAPPPGAMHAGTDTDRFFHEGPRYLDSFFLDTADLLDEFPNKDADGSSEADLLDPMALSTFCFPDGLRVRIVPRAAMEGAKRLGWTGRKADRRHLLVVSFFCVVLFFTYHVYGLLDCKARTS